MPARRSRLPQAAPASQKRTVPRGRSTAEELFAIQCRSLTHINQPLREYRFAAPRRWRFDFFFEAQNVAVEVEGGVWQMGRHNRGAGFEADCRKYNAASAMGIRVFRVTSGMVQSGEAITFMTGVFG